MFRKSRSWCCAGMEGLFGERHGRGLYVFARSPDATGQARPLFFIAARVVPQSELTAFRKALTVSGYPGPVSTELETGMQFCPWCGVKLERFYKGTYSQLVDASVGANVGTV